MRFGWQLWGLILGGCPLGALAQPLQLFISPTDPWLEIPAEVYQPSEGRYRLLLHTERLPTHELRQVAELQVSVLASDTNSLKVVTPQDSVRKVAPFEATSGTLALEGDMLPKRRYFFSVGYYHTDGSLLGGNLLWLDPPPGGLFRPFTDTASVRLRYQAAPVPAVSSRPEQPTVANSAHHQTPSGLSWQATPAGFPRPVIWQLATDTLTAFDWRDVLAYWHTGREHRKWQESFPDSSLLREEHGLDSALSAFWQQNGGHPTDSLFRARLPVVQARFADAAPGWTTDAGMVYLMLGPPQAVSRGVYAEQWVYANATGSEAPLSFRFRRVKVGQNLARLVLTPDRRLQPAWDLAVRAWRDGDAADAP